MSIKKNKNNPFIDFLFEEFSSHPQSKKTLRRKSSGQKKRSGLEVVKSTDHLLLDMLIKEKYRKVLSKMGNIEKSLDYHLKKADKKKSKEIRDIEDRLVLEWQREFIALREEILRSIPVEQRKKYRQMLSDHIKDSINHPHHLYPFTIPVDKRDFAKNRVAHSALKVVTAALIALIFSISLVSISPSLSNRITSFTDKVLAYPIVMVDQIFYSGSLTTRGVALNKKTKEIDSEVLSDYIVKNKDNFNSNEQGEIFLTEKDIFGSVAGVDELVVDVDNREEEESDKLVLTQLKKLANKISEAQKQLSFDLEKKLNNFLMNF